MQLCSYRIRNSVRLYFILKTYRLCHLPAGNRWRRSVFVYSSITSFILEQHPSIAFFAVDNPSHLNYVFNWIRTLVVLTSFKLYFAQIIATKMVVLALWLFVNGILFIFGRYRELNSSLTPYCYGAGYLINEQENCFPGIVLAIKQNKRVSLYSFSTGGTTPRARRCRSSKSMSAGRCRPWPKPGCPSSPRGPELTGGTCPTSESGMRHNSTLDHKLTIFPVAYTTMLLLELINVVVEDRGHKEA